jgi:hypothetical protein
LSAETSVGATSQTGKPTNAGLEGTSSMQAQVI